MNPYGSALETGPVLFRASAPVNWSITFLKFPGHVLQQHKRQ